MVRVDNSEQAVLADHFTLYEWQQLAQQGAAAGMKKLQAYLGGRLAVWLSCLLALVIANAAVGATGPIDASETLLQISFILLALFMVAVPLDTLRLAQFAAVVRVDAVVTVLDVTSIARRLSEPANCVDNGAREGNTQMAECEKQQLAAADLLVVNKTDLLGATELKQVRTWLADSAPQARQLQCQQLRW